MSIYKTEGCMVVLCDKSECFSTNRVPLVPGRIMCYTSCLSLYGKVTWKKALHSE